MHTDARTLESGVTLESDICIIGAGAAGITIARELAGTSHTVHLLESGGFESDSEIQSLYKGENVGLPYADLTAARLRYFGGTTNHWGGCCAPLDPIDFEERPWVPHSGWPITRADLDPYYERAQPICDLAAYRYDDLSYWEDESINRTRLPLSEERFTTKIFQYSRTKTRFGEKYRDEILNAQNVHLFTHANVTNIEANENASRISRLEVQCLEGLRFWARARHYVLACGGIENPRLLLVSNGVAPNGLGNDHDLVGRFFMEHPHLPCATAILTGGTPYLGLYSWFRKNRTNIRAGLRVHRTVQRDLGILNFFTMLYDTKEQTGYEAVRAIYYQFRKGAPDDNFPENLATVISDFDSFVSDANRKLLGKPVYSPRSVEVTARLDQTPNPNSRVMLSDERDQLGLPRLQLHWQLTDLDKRTLRESVQLLGREFGRTGLGRVQLPEWLFTDGDDWPSSLHGGFHHMGTTRMSTDPKRGVVDANCKVHGLDNLFVAGSSVYATAGNANPTLTIVALALRLADHVEERLQAEAQLSAAG